MPKKSRFADLGHFEEPETYSQDSPIVRVCGPESPQDIVGNLEQACAEVTHNATSTIRDTIDRETEKSVGTLEETHVRMTEKSVKTIDDAADRCCERIKASSEAALKGMVTIPSWMFFALIFCTVIGIAFITVVYCSALPDEKSLLGTILRNAVTVAAILLFLPLYIHFLWHLKDR